jgi:hypothetical protein
MSVALRYVMEVWSEVQRSQDTDSLALWRRDMTECGAWTVAMETTSGTRALHLVTLAEMS